MKDSPVKTPHPGPSAGPTSGTGPAPAPQAHFPTDNDVHLLDRVAVVYRYRYIAMTVFVLAAMAMMIQGYTAIQVYQTQARLLIENERSTTLPGLTSAPDAFYEDPEPYYETQYKILRGRDLARRVVKRVKLETIPEFNGTAVAPPSPATLLGDARRRILGLFTTPPAAEPPKADESQDESALVSAFIGHVTVQPVRGSRLVDVLFDSQTAAFAAEAVNALVDEYVNQNLAFKLQGAQNMLEWLGKELANQQKKVEDS